MLTFIGGPRGPLVLIPLPPPPPPCRTQFFRFYICFHRKAPLSKVGTPATGNPGSATELAWYCKGACLTTSRWWITPHLNVSEDQYTSVDPWGPASVHPQSIQPDSVSFILPCIFTEKHRHQRSAPPTGNPGSATSI